MEKRTLFIGHTGLRAGWSLLIATSPFILLLLAMRYYLGIGMSPPASGQTLQTLQPLTTIVAEAISFLVIAAVTLLMSVIERRGFAGYGLAPAHLLRQFSMGLASGVAALSLLIAALYLTHSISFTGHALHLTTALGFAAAWALAFLCVGLFEEFLFRGYLQFTLARGLTGIARTLHVPHPEAIGFWSAALILSVGFFAYTHTSNGGETPSGIAAVGLAGIVFAFALYRTGSLWWAIGFHTAWDWAQSFLYGTPDSGARAAGHFLDSHPIGNPLLSGASAGPEGSLLVIPTLLLVALLIHLTLPAKPAPPIYTEPA